jgi:hypothetical protein
MADRGRHCQAPFIEFSAASATRKNCSMYLMGGALNVVPTPREYFFSYIESLENELV